MDLYYKVLSWLDVHIMATKIKVTAFMVGVQATASCIIVALQEDRMPVVYTLLGE